MKVWALAAAVVLAACGQQQNAAAPASAVPAITTWDSIPVNTITAPEGVSYVIARTDGGFAAQISNVPANALASGATQGVSIRLPDSMEDAASGMQVRVTVRAASPAGGRLGAAYSTAEVGSSGWQEFALTPTPADYTFDYSVGAKINGGGDYLGFRNIGAAPVQVLGYRVDVIGPGQP